jgi:hypothetical protein
VVAEDEPDRPIPERACFCPHLAAGKGNGERWSTLRVGGRCVATTATACVKRLLVAERTGDVVSPFGETRVRVGVDVHHILLDENILQDLISDFGREKVEDWAVCAMRVARSRRVHRGRPTGPTITEIIPSYLKWSVKR